MRSDYNQIFDPLRRFDVATQRSRCEWQPVFRKIVRNTYDWHVECPLVLRCILNHFNAILTVWPATGATTGKTHNTRTITKHARPVETEALPFKHLDIMSKIVCKIFDP